MGAMASHGQPLWLAMVDHFGKPWPWLAMVNHCDDGQPWPAMARAFQNDLGGIPQTMTNKNLPCELVIHQLFLLLMDQCHLTMAMTIMDQMHLPCPWPCPSMYPVAVL